jgi:hypothetical protein
LLFLIFLPLGVAIREEPIDLLFTLLAIVTVWSW